MSSPLFDVMSGDMSIGEFLAWFIALFVAITVHEFSHAKSAEIAGDPTPRSQGRVTLNPLAHYDPIGSTLILLVGFGWGKPVMVNPLNFRSPRWDNLRVSLWGPLSNLIVAALFAMPLRFDFAGAYTQAFFVLVLVNVFLAIFNLIPVAPLDGSHILESLLPPKTNQRLQAFHSRHRGILMIAFLAMLWVPQLWRIVSPVVTVPALFIVGLLVGHPLVR